MMIYEERVMAALNLEIPDRIPTHIVALDGNLVDQILGKSRKNAFDIMHELKEQYGEEWTNKFNIMLDDVEASVFSRMMQATEQLGFDSCQTGYIPFIIESESEMRDIFGRKYKIVNNEGNIFPYYTGGLIPDRKAWEQWPEPDIHDLLRRAKKVYRSASRKVKKNMMVFAADDYTSIFPPVWQGMGMNNFVKALIRDPQLIEERFEMTTEFVIKLFRTYYEAGARVFFEGGDIAYKSGPLINPKYIYKYVLPSYKKLTAAVHEWGGKIIFHSDGDITSILDFIVEAGFDGLHCLETASNVDPQYVKEKVGDKLCLLGNIDTMHVLTEEGTREEVEKSVIDVIKAAGHSGGFILSPSNAHPAMSIRNIKWMIEAVHKYGNYPLKFH